MRPAAYLSLAVLTVLGACASTDDWHTIQRDRIDRLHRVRTPAVAMVEVLSKAPEQIEIEAREPLPAPEPVPIAKVRKAKAPQDHLDQRLPQAPGQGPRSFRRSFQPLEVTLDVGVGNVAAKVGGTYLSDREDANFARLRIDSGPGAALHGEIWSSDGNLFQGRMINDGIVPVAANAELNGFDLFPHMRFDHQIGDWQIPVRVGVFADYQQLDHQRARVERDWISAGPRVLVEPTYNLVDDGGGRLDLFTRIGGDVGAAWFAEEFRNGDSLDSTIRWTGELGAGLRGSYGALHAELGYRVVHTTFGELAGDLYGDRNRTELQRQQIFLGFGFTY